MPVTKQERLAELKKRMLADVKLPLRAGATQLVFGEGNPDTKVYFLGEAPGYYEDREGRPFVGQAGKLLDQLIADIGLSRDQVYISNVVRYRPPGNRDPEPDELAAFAPYVDEEIKIIDPRVIATLGRFSMGKFIPDVKISQVHGKAFKVNFLGADRLVLPMYHPAAALRSTGVLNLLKEDFKLIKRALEKPIPTEDFVDQVAGKKEEEAAQLNLI